MTCVGSLTQVRLRLAQQPHGNDIRLYTQHFEIVSLGAFAAGGDGNSVLIRHLAVGTISNEGEHLHISLSDHEGKTIGIARLSVPLSLRL